MSDNTLTIVGKLSRDPTLVTAASGQAMCRFTIGVSHKYKVNSGRDLKEHINYFEVRCFEELAENIVESCQRGDSVIVVGKLSRSIPTGDAPSVVEVFAQHVGIDLRSMSLPIE